MRITELDSNHYLVHHPKLIEQTVKRYILVLDNATIKKEYLNICDWMAMCLNYYLNINLIDLKVIITIPNGLKYYNVNKNNLFTIFDNLKCFNNQNISQKTEYLDNIVNIIPRDSIETELVIFSEIGHLDSIKNFTKFIIQNKNISCMIISKYHNIQLVDQEGIVYISLDQNIEYVTVIKNHLPFKNMVFTKYIHGKFTLPYILKNIDGIKNISSYSKFTNKNIKELLLAFEVMLIHNEPISNLKNLLKIETTVPEILAEIKCIIRHIPLDDICKIKANIDITKILVKLSQRVLLKDKKYIKRLKSSLKNKSYIVNEIENISKLLKTSKIKNFIKNCENNNHITFKKACEFYYSIISCSNWFDELKDGSPMGLLINLQPYHGTILGFSDKCFIKTVSLTIYPINDYFELLNSKFNSEKHLNLYHNIIEGRAIGETNMILPLYINKYHWIIARKYYDITMGLSLTHNPLYFNKRNRLYILSIFMTMMRKTFYEENHNNGKWIQYLISVLRTCAEICFELKYNRGIRKHIVNYLKSPKEFKHHDDYINVINQCIVTGYILEEIQIKKLIDIIYGKVMHCIAKTNNISNENLILEYIKEDKKNLTSFYHMNGMMRKILNYYGSYSKFIKKMEQNFGLIDDELVEKLTDYIKNNFQINVRKLFINNI